MFVLNNEELNNLRSQIATSNWGGSRYGHMAFTEQGVAMLSSVLNSESDSNNTSRFQDLHDPVERAFVVSLLSLHD
jgi:hypothetical protein